MKKIATAVSFILILLIAGSVPFLLVKAESTAIVVPDNYSTIRAAIGNATAGDTIVVKNGTYDEPAWQIDKPLTITSESIYQAKIVFHPSTYEQTIQVGRLESSRITTVHFGDSIHILADRVKVSGFVIANTPMDFSVNSTQVGKDETGTICANGNQIQISDNIFGTEKAYFRLSLTGNENQVLHNTAAVISIVGSNQTISHNNIRGIDVSGSFNVISKNYAGGLNLIGDNNSVCENSFTSDHGGGTIALVGANYNTFSDNTIVSDGTVGIAFGYANPEGGSYNVFSRNIVKGAKLWGILLGKGSNNVFVGNLIANNGGLGHDGYGVALGGVNIAVNNNLFYDNIFMNNSKNFGTNWEVIGLNGFDNGERGNYWDDYLTKYPYALEIDHLGIGNIPYSVYGNVNDNYPLINIPKLPDIITPIPWSTSFLNQSTSSQGTTSQGGRTTTSSNSPSDNTTNSVPSGKNSGLNLPSEIIITAFAVTIVGLVVVVIVFNVKKHKPRVEDA